METEINRSDSIKEIIKARANRLGFCLCGITSAAPLADFSRYENWIQNGFHGEMKYLASNRHLSLRANPVQLVPWVKSIIVVAWSYPLNRSSDESSGQIAGYVDSIDYHELLPEKLVELVENLKIELKSPLRAEIFCDSAPILERELAVRAGLGWIGHNSCLISPVYGSAILLGEIFLDIELPVDPPFTRDLCGSCQRCQIACPTGCIMPDRLIDARDCISNLTIENKQLIPASDYSNIANHLFGCDICQVACPWNRNIAAQQESLAQMDAESMIADLSLTSDQFKKTYSLSPILRAKRSGWIRNLCMVLANTDSLVAIEPLTQMLIHDSDPLCRLSAAQALLRLEPNEAWPLINQVLQNEPNLLLLSERYQLI